jgi:DNA-binding protein HU-beta
MANRQTIIDAVATDLSVTKKDSVTIVASVFEAVQNSLVEEGAVQLAGFGTFTVSKRAARKGINPRTMESIKVPAVKVVGFRAGQGLKDAVNG